MKLDLLRNKKCTVICRYGDGAKIKGLIKVYEDGVFLLTNSSDLDGLTPMTSIANTGYEHSWCLSDTISRGQTEVDLTDRKLLEYYDISKLIIHDGIRLNNILMEL